MSFGELVALHIHPDPSIVLNKDLKEVVHCSPMNCSMHNDKTKTILQGQNQDQAFLFPVTARLSCNIM